MIRCPNCNKECPDGSKFCRSCGKLIQKTCPSCGLVVDPQDSFCQQCGTSLTAATPPSFEKTTEEESKEIDQFEGSRKHVTIFFSDVTGSTVLSSGLDPEKIREMMVPVLKAMSSAVHEYGGTVIKAAGDGIMALFGAPISYEDHPLRACHAALLLQKTIRELKSQISVRVGINSGEAIVDLIGSDARKEYDAMGTAVALAARMEQMALPGTVQISTDTYQLVKDAVLVKSNGMQLVKGFPEPMEIFELTGVKKDFTRFVQLKTSQLTRFQGRTKEMSLLNSTLAMAIQGQGRIIGIVGEPGEGKSRLVYEFMNFSSAKDHVQYISQCQAMMNNNSFFSVRQILRGIFGIFDQPPEEQQAIVRKTLEVFKEDYNEYLNVSFAILNFPLKDPEWESLSPEFKRVKTLNGFVKLIISMDLQKPIILLIEDIQWIDEDSLECVNRLGKQLINHKILLILTYRPEFDDSAYDRNNFARIPIVPLPRDNFYELVTNILGPDAGLEPLKQKLVERCHGNPFFLEETVRSLKDHGELEGSQGNYFLTHPVDNIILPNSVQSVLEARVELLDYEDKKIIRTCAVIGKTIPLNLLKLVSNVKEVDLEQALAKISDKKFISKTQEFPEIIYTFIHDVVLDTIYKGILKKQKKIIHLSLLHSLEINYQGNDLEQMTIKAHHAFRGENWDKALNYYIALQLNAHLRSSPLEAIAHFDKATDAYYNIVNPTKEQTQRYLNALYRKGHECIWLGRNQEVILLFETGKDLITASSDKIAEIELNAFLGNLGNLGSGKYIEALKYAEKALAVLEEVEKETRANYEDLRVLVYQALVHAYHYSDEYRKEIDYGLSALEFLQDPTKSDKTTGGPVWTIIQVWIIMASALIGDTIVGKKCETDLLRFLKIEKPSAALHICYFGLCVYYANIADWEQALKYADLSREIGRQLGITLALNAVLSVQGYIYSLQNKNKEAEVLLDRAYEMDKEGDFIFFASRSLDFLCQGYINLKKIERAKAIVDRMFELAEKQKHKVMEVYGWRFKAEIDRLEGKVPPNEVEDEFKKALNLAESMGMLPEVERIRTSMAIH